MYSPIIGVDMDGVLVDLIEGWIESYYERTGVLYTKDQFTDFDAGNIVDDPESFYALMLEDGFFRNKRPQPGAVEGFNKLRAMPVTVHIVTSPPAASPFSEKDKKAWMVEHFPDFNLKDMHFTHHKWMIGTDLLIDDAVKNLDPIRVLGRKTLCFDQPWNQEWEGPRAYTWEDVLQFVEENFV